MKRSAVLLFGLASLINIEASAYPSPASVSFNIGEIPQEFKTIYWEYGFKCNNFGGSSWIDLKKRTNLEIECKGEVNQSNFYGVADPDNNIYGMERLFAAGDEKLIGPGMLNLVEPTKPLCSLDTVRGNSTVSLEYEQAVSKADKLQFGYYVSCQVENQ